MSQQPTTMGRRTSMTGMIRAQAIQFLHQRGILLTALASSVLYLALNVVAASAIARSVLGGTERISQEQIMEIPTYAFNFTQLLMGAACILLVTMEWSSGSILTSIITTQSKGGIMLSKTLVAAAASALASLAGIGLTIPLCNLFLVPADRKLDVMDAAFQRELTGIVLASILSVLLAVGLAFLIRRTAQTLVAYVTLIIVAPLAIGTIPMTAIRKVTAYLPMNASGYMMIPNTPAGGLTPAAATAVMAAWAATALLAGVLRTLKAKRII